MILADTSKMKAAALATLLLALVLPHGKGKGNVGCTHFDLKGTLESPSTTFFELEQAKKQGGTTTFRVAITPSTQVFWTGRGTLAGPVSGEHVWAKGQHCGSTYTATWVLVSPPQ
jgi:hypothetical protein